MISFTFITLGIGIMIGWTFGIIFLSLLNLKVFNKIKENMIWLLLSPLILDNEKRKLEEKRFIELMNIYEKEKKQ